MAKTTRIITTPTSEVVVPERVHTPEQEEKLTALREYADSIRLPEDDPYYPWEDRFLRNPTTIPRYMRAAKWKLDDAKKRISGTLTWRKEYQPDLIPPEEVKIEAETGKIILNGFDKEGRPIIYMRPDRENQQTSDRQLRHLVWYLERARDMMPHGQDSVVILIDYARTTMRNNPPVSVARKVIVILQQHYVETLGRGLVINLPWVLNFFYKAISPFLDPITKDKIRFNPVLTELIPEAQLDAEFGGQNEYEFDHETYWSQLCEVGNYAADGTRNLDEQGQPAPAPSTAAAEATETNGSAEPATTESDSKTAVDNEEPHLNGDAAPNGTPHAHAVEPTPDS